MTTKTVLFSLTACCLAIQINSQNSLYKPNDDLNQSFTEEDGEMNYKTGTFTLHKDLNYSTESSKGERDIYLIKQNEQNETIWAFRVGGEGDEKINALKIIENRILIAGQFSKYVDFDPTSSVFNLETEQKTAGFVVEYNSRGNFIKAIKLESAVTSINQIQDTDTGENFFVFTSHNNEIKSEEKSQTFVYTSDLKKCIGTGTGENDHELVQSILEKNQTKESTQLNSIQKQFSVFPNPGNGVYTIKSNVPDNLSIYNISGKKIMEQAIKEGSNTLDIQNFAPGVYYIKTCDLSNNIKLIKGE